MIDKPWRSGSPILDDNSVESESAQVMGTLNIRPSRLGSPDGHSDRVALYALAIGQCMDISEELLNNLKMGAMLHDIGKVGISRQIVDKLGRLTDREFEIMRLHSTIAVRMLENVDGLGECIPMIKHHHERFDGKGYPDGLAGHDIPLGARIIAVAETFDILVSNVPWRDSLTLEKAVKEIRECSGTQFDPMVVDAFVDAIEANRLNVQSLDETIESLSEYKKVN